MFYNPAIPGAGGVGPYWYYDNEVLDVTIPAMRTIRGSRRRPARRVGSGAVTVKVTGVAATAFTYDLLVPWDRIPADPSVRLAKPTSR